MPVLLNCHHCGKEYKKIPCEAAKSKYCSKLCKDKKHPIKHGMARTAIYKRWNGMRSRCLHKSSRWYINYGGRGIRVCESWNSFENFYADMGDIPFPGAQLDRIDNEGNYEPGNVQWVDHRTNSRNRRTSVYVTVDGKVFCFLEACEIIGVCHKAAHGKRKTWEMSHQETIDYFVFKTRLGKTSISTNPSTPVTDNLLNPGEVSPGETKE